MAEQAISAATTSVDAIVAAEDGLLALTGCLRQLRFGGGRFGRMMQVGSMRYRIAMWAIAGFVVMSFWAVYFLELNGNSCPPVKSWRLHRGRSQWKHWNRRGCERRS